MTTLIVILKLWLLFYLAIVLLWANVATRTAR
jgi:hypothetical protein